MDNEKKFEFFNKLLEAQIVLLLLGAIFMLLGLAEINIGSVAIKIDSSLRLVAVFLGALLTHLTQ